MDRELETWQLVSSLLTSEENIHLFSFHTDFATITDFDNYCNTLHYSTDINSLILQRMAAGEYELTPDNYESHWQEVEAFYSTYDYDSIFE